VSAQQVGWGVLGAIAVGGALGAAARFGLAVVWPHAPGGFPWATFATNAIGSCALGVLMELLAGLTAPHRLLRPFLGTGVLGGFTTFSTYALETRELIEAGRPGLAIAYVGGTLVAALAALAIGMLGVRLLRRPR
jgi:CrcB protein